MGESVMEIGKRNKIFPTFHQRRMVSIILSGGIGQKKSIGRARLFPGVSFVGLAF